MFEFDTFKKLYIDCSNAIIKHRNFTNNNQKIYDLSIKTLNPDSQYLGIDAINFQNKIDNANIEHYSNILTLIENRIYGDYYKIYKSINKFYSQFNNSKEFVKSKDDKDFNNDNNDKEFPIYKDLEKKGYDIELIINIHDKINNLLELVEEEFNTKINGLLNTIISTEKSRAQNIQYLNKYYITEEQTNLAILENRLEMYKKYISNAYKIHCIYLSGLHSQITNLSIDNDLDDDLDDNTDDNTDKDDNNEENIHLSENIIINENAIIHGIEYNN